MTDEKARRIIIQNTESLKANPLVTVDDCLYEAFDKAINALEQRGCVWEIAYERGKVEVLDKIKAEIERKAHSGQWSDATMYGMLKAVAIIDKYRVGSEDEE